ncbi:MAG TPA: hypothetical protein VGN69_09230 [Solirubrobacteraceae bacterium]|jgi:hypothetical protein|nr:hypothetical protein [Solirubrobacteraceae bacterium]
MSDTGYKLLGFAVWRGARWYLRRHYGHYLPPRRVLAAGTVVVAVGALALANARRSAA